MTNSRRGWALGRDGSPDHHQSLVRDLLDQAPAKAAHALRAHIRRGLAHELKEMENQPDESHKEES